MHRNSTVRRAYWVQETADLHGYDSDCTGHWSVCPRMHFPQRPMPRNRSASTLTMNIDISSVRRKLPVRHACWERGVAEKLLLYHLCFQRTVCRVWSSGQHITLCTILLSRPFNFAVRYLLLTNCHLSHESLPSCSVQFLVLLDS